MQSPIAVGVVTSLQDATRAKERRTAGRAGFRRPSHVRWRYANKWWASRTVSKYVTSSVTQLGGTPWTCNDATCCVPAEASRKQRVYLHCTRGNWQWPTAVTDCHRLLQTATDYGRLPETISDYLRLRQNTREYGRLPETTSDCQRLLQTATEYFRLPQTTADCRRLFQTASDYGRIPETTADCQRLLQTATDYCRLPRNTSESHRLLHVPQTTTD